jgi:hypothetical protein
VKLEYKKEPSRYAINRLVNKYKRKCGSVIDDKKAVVGKKTTVRTSEKIQCVDAESQEMCKAFFSTTHFPHTTNLRHIKTQ